MVDCGGLASKLLRVKRNGTARLCTAEMKMSRPNKVAAEQLLKTKFCFFMTGRCSQADCKYAHGFRELKHALDLKKTKLCFEFLQGCCRRGAECPFAHSYEDLRVTASVYKTQPCYFFERGSCRKGLRRRHAHGVGERRCSLTIPFHSPNSEPRVHRPLLLADLLPEDRIGFAGLSAHEIAVDSFFLPCSYCDGFQWDL